MLKIVTPPNSALSSVAKPVAIKPGPIFKVDTKIRTLISEMKKTLLAASDPMGVGLAAPQVGKSLQIFLTKPTIKSKISVFINPKIIEQCSSKKINKKQDEDGSQKLEGCLSLPAIWGPVDRTHSLTLNFLDEKGKEHTEKFSGLMATIIQHEMDHLNGILFPKRILEQKGVLYKSRKNRKGEDVFEEIEI